MALAFTSDCNTTAELVAESGGGYRELQVLAHYAAARLEPLFFLLQRSAMSCHVNVRRCMCVSCGEWILFAVHHMCVFCIMHKVVRCDIFAICYCMELRVSRSPAYTLCMALAK